MRQVRALHVRDPSPRPAAPADRPRSAPRFCWRCAAPLLQRRDFVALRDLGRAEAAASGNHQDAASPHDVVDPLGVQLLVDEAVDAQAAEPVRDRRGVARTSPCSAREAQRSRPRRCPAAPDRVTPAEASAIASSSAGPVRLMFLPCVVRPAAGAAGVTRDHRRAVPTSPLQSRTMPPATSDYEKLGVFYLGRRFDPDTKKTTDDLVLYDSQRPRHARPLRRHDRQRQDRARHRA